MVKNGEKLKKKGYEIHPPIEIGGLPASFDKKTLRP